MAIRSVAKTVSEVDPCCFTDPRDLIHRLSDVTARLPEDDRPRSGQRPTNPPTDSRERVSRPGDRRQTTDRPPTDRPCEGATERPTDRRTSQHSNNNRNKNTSRSNNYKSLARACLATGCLFTSALCDFRMASAAQLAKRAFVKVLLTFALAYSLTLSITRDSDDGSVTSAFRQVASTS